MESQTPELPRDVVETRHAPTEVLRAMAFRPALGDLRVTALETLSERTGILEEDFRSVFLSPIVWSAPDEHVRWLAVKALAVRSPERFAEPLLEALSDPSWLVREHAVLACLKALRNLSEDGLQSMRRGTHAWRHEVLSEVLFFLRSPSREVRGAVEDVIAEWTELDPPACIAAFQGRLAAGPRREVRHVTAGVLGGLLRALPRAESLAAAREFAWTLEAFEAGLSHGDAATNVALAPLARSLTRLFVEESNPLPDAIPSLLLRFLTDPNPKVVRGVEAVLEEPAVLACLLTHPRVVGGASARRMRPLPQAALAWILGAASRASWTSEEFPAAARTAASELAFRHAGSEDFRVRRAARSLLGALGQGLVPALICASREELRRVEHDAPLAKRLASAADPWSFRTLCEEAGAVGGQACLETLESLLTRHPEESVSGPAWRARLALCGRLFALRSFLVVLWHSPERESDAGGPIREILARMLNHPTPFVREAARNGR